ncbi:hypothetical protein D9M73_194500 [compost metagenome]
MQETHGAVHGFRRLTEDQEDAFEIPQQQPGQQRQPHAHPQAGAGDPGDALRIAGAMADRDQIAHRRHHADAAHRHEGIAGGTQAAAGQGLRTEFAHHQGVGEDHRHIGQLGGNQRPGKAQDCGEFTAVRLLHG